MREKRLQDLTIMYYWAMESTHIPGSEGAGIRKPEHKLWNNIIIIIELFYNINNIIITYNNIVIIIIILLYNIIIITLNNNIIIIELFQDTRFKALAETQKLWICF